ncbi:MAG TPA: hypothetical protein VNN79_03310 [Actinomycetota bacterium]|nr:hypothetical protein [Actinomycetota bacterium]
MEGHPRRVVAAIGNVLALVLFVVTAHARPAEGAQWHDVPGTKCAVFPTDNVWNTDVSKLPVNPHSAEWLRSMHAGSTNLHPDFGPPSYGMPFAVTGASTAKHRLRFQYSGQSDKVAYPFGPNTPIEGGQHSNGDRHALMVDRSTCTLYELYRAFWNGGSPKAGSGAVFDLRRNDLRPDGWTSADAAGLAIFPGLVRFDEIKAGFIGHAIRFTADHTRDQHIWPARHDASDLTAVRYPPMGARFRLKAGFNLQGFSRDARVVLTAMKHYGLILADNGSDWYFQGTRDSRWTNALLDQLKRVPASAFEAVDESACMVSANSAQADCPA